MYSVSRPDAGGNKKQKGEIKFSPFCVPDVWFKQLFLRD